MSKEASPGRGKPRTAPCPNCGQPALLGAGNAWRPFCSERCKLIDLGAWFKEERSIPSAEPDDTFSDGS